MIFEVLKPYTSKQRVVISLFVFDIFAWLIAPFSKYYISNIEIYSDLMCLISLMTLGAGMTSRGNVNISMRYMMACLAIILTPVIVHGDFPFVSIISKLIFVVCFLSLRAQFKWAICDVFTKVFTVILALGIIEWLLLLVNINFFWAIVERSETQLFNQGIFVLVPTYSFEGYARFMSLCEEPGTMGTICFFLLITLDYHKNKRQFFVLLVAGLISFSLGFYVLIILWALTQGRKFGLSNYLLAVIAVVLMMSLFGLFFEERILGRVTGRSFESIDNRTNEVVDKKMKELTDNGSIVWGMGNRSFYEWEKKVGGVSAGVKNFIIQYGVIGLFILTLTYSTLIIRIRGLKRETIILLVFVWIAFYKSNTWNSPPIIVPVLSIPISLAFQDKKFQSKRTRFVRPLNKSI